MSRRGIGLGTTLVVVALVATLGFLVTQASVSHQQTMARTSNEAYALDLARSTLSLAVERVFSDDKFGTWASEDQLIHGPAAGPALQPWGIPDGGCPTQAPTPRPPIRAQRV